MTNDKTPTSDAAREMPEEIYIEGGITPRGYLRIDKWSATPINERIILPGNSITKYTRAVTAQTPCVDIFELIADRITKLAFSMPAPNAYTPQLVMLANEIRLLRTKSTMETGL